MAKSYLDKDGLLYFWQKIKNLFVADVTYDSSTKKIQKTKSGTASDVVTLSTVATSGSYNDLSNKPTIPTLKNVFGKVKVGSTTIEADTTQDTLEIVAGSNVTVTPDATNDKITIAATDTTYSDFTGATDSAAGVHGLVPAPSSGDTSAVIFSDGKWHTFGVGRNAESVLITHHAPSESPKTLLTFGVATTTLAGAMSPSNYNKLYGIAEGAEVNQNAFSNVKVGSTTVAADSKTDTLEFVAGSNVTITPDATNDKITIAATDTKYTAASETPNMDGTGAVGTSTKYAREDHVHPSDTSRVPTTRTVNGHALSADVTVTASDIGVESGAEVNQNAFSTLKYAKNSSDTVKTARTADSKTSDFLIIGGGAIEVSSAIHSSVHGVQVALFAATSSQNGYMSSGDKAKLDSLTITDGVIDASNLPSYVDDVIEAYARSGQTPLSSAWLATGSASGTVITPEAGKIYVLMADSGDYAANTQFRWGGTAYVKMADGGVSSITNAEIDTIVAS